MIRGLFPSPSLRCRPLARAAQFVHAWPLRGRPMIQPPGPAPDVPGRVDRILNRAYSLVEALDALGDRTGTLPEQPVGDSASRLASLLGGEAKRDEALRRYGLTAGQIDSLREGR